jgi:ribosomal protein L11 methyltransferase
VPVAWLQISVQTDASTLDAVSNFLIERGSPGVVIKKEEVQAYFAHSAGDRLIRRDIQHFLRAINGIYRDIDEPRLRCRILRDRNWNSSWRRFFKPQKVGKRFWVMPPWAPPPRLRHREVLTIKPGMAFGTGNHATTRGCMELIEKAARPSANKEFTALDVGTGSGILAIAMAKLGAKKVWALDNDPVALKVARENVRYNAVQHSVHLSMTKLGRLKKSFPLVVANLTAETLLDLAGALEKRVALEGSLVLSGILKPKARQVVRRFSRHGFRVLSRKGEKEWVTLLLRRR